MTVTDTLPPGVTAVESGELVQQGGIEKFLWDCSGTSVVTCTSDETGLPSIHTGEFVKIGIEVQVSPSAAGSEANHVTVTGGGALKPASTEAQLVYGSVPASFGLTGSDTWFTNADGTSDTQAGSHPYEMTVVFGFNNQFNPIGGSPIPVGEGRDVEVDLPPGLIGDPGVVPQCTHAQFDEDGCSAASQIGREVAALGNFEVHPAEGHFPIYNLVPSPGLPAQFGFDFNGIHVYLNAGVRSGSDYSIAEHVNNIPQRKIIYSTTTIWGVPADPIHDSERFAIPNCEEGCSSGDAPRPLLTMPTACSGAQTVTVHADTWQAPTLHSQQSILTHDESLNPVGFGGCDRLSFNPSISVSPDTSFADTPTGVSVEVRVPQEALQAPEGITTADIENTQVTLPPGMVINPGQAAGLAACQEDQSGLGTEGPARCPNASKVGTVEISTPLLPDKLEGSIYVLQSNPPDVKLLVAASADGVHLKLVGDVHMDTFTGQLTTTFEKTPELPFTVFKLAFSGGAQAALTTPTTCGAYSTAADFTPWATPFVGDGLESSSFLIDHGPGGSPCSSPLPFSPSLIAGSTTDQAGGFTDFSMLLTREDGQQRIGSLQFETPEGLLGMIGKVPLCPEPQASQGTCSVASQIGHTVLEAGPGPYPLVVPQPGQPPAPIYLTGGYEGAPYGLSIVVPLHVGPFILQTQVVRAKIAVDPITTRLTITTDPLPTIVDGVPADLRAIDAVIDRPEFMFNPTGCEAQTFSGVATSTEGTTAPISSHFQMGSCRSLTFAPKFTASTSGKTSRANGASLDAKIVYPKVVPGANQASSQANVKSVKVDLPKQLPSRLTTLQKACPAAKFQADPASCPSESKVGMATAVTPVLPVTLTGPAYFVSYGGAKFPELVIVLQGYGVTVSLHGETFINEKNGITSSTFRQVPDVPIVSFELKLPQGKFSALAANGNLCNSKLKMPTIFTGQNGSVMRQSTSIKVNGCAARRARKHKRS
ncbi:MAG TPA: hypothetical protein VGI26_02170 [Solirubrobacteraceae bacterium]